MTAIFLVESPLQLLNAMEARNALVNNEICVLIMLRGVSKKNLDQMKGLVDEFWNEVHILEHTHNRWKYYRPRRKLDAILRNYRSIGLICIGEYRSILMRHFANKSGSKNIFLLDDGNFSLYIQKSILARKGIRNDYHIVRKLYDSVIGLKDSDILDIKFFSVYTHNLNRSNRDRFVINSYEKAKEKLIRKKRNSKVMFIGNNTPELGVISLDSYKELLFKVKDYYKGVEVLYVPHRREAKEKVNWVNQELGFGILLVDKPVEWHLLEGNELPQRIASFFSSALDNCHYIFGSELKIDSFKIDSRLILIDEYKDRAAMNYDNYSNYLSSTFTIVE